MGISCANCGCRNKNDSTGQPSGWWFFRQYNTGRRVFNGWHCPTCSGLVYDETKANKTRV